MRKIKIWLAVKLFRLAERLYRGLWPEDRVQVFLGRHVDLKKLDAMSGRLKELAFAPPTGHLPPSVPVHDGVWRHRDTVPEVVD